MTAIVFALVLAATPPQSAGDSTYKRADALFVAKKFPEALAAVEEALRLDPKLIPALTLKAKMALATNRFDVARRCLEQALAIDPHASYAQFLYGLEAYLSNEMKQALPRFRKARDLDPADPRSALYLGLTTESLGQPAEALALYEEAVKLENAAGKPHADTFLPGARLLLLLGREEESESWTRQALKLAPNSRDAHFELARVVLKRGEAAQAAAEGEKALTLTDGVATDAAIHFLLIRAWRQNGRPDLAEMHAAVIRAQETQPSGKL